VIPCRVPALPSQRRFFESKAKFKGFSGPIGSGKTYALCYQALMLATDSPGTLGLIGAPTYPMLRDVTIPTMLDILEAHRIPYTWRKQRHLLALHRSGSRAIFRPLENYERLRGTNLAWFGVDELTYCRREAWQRLEGRLREPRARRLCGFGVWTPNGFDWVYKRFIAPHTRLAEYEAVIAAPGENVFVLERTPDYYEVLKASYDELFFRQEALGEYLNVYAGRVYHAFDEANVAETLHNPVAPILWSLDFNVDPMVSLVCQEAGGRISVLEEIALHVATTYAMCERFEARTREAGWLEAWRRVNGGRPLELWVYGDAAGGARRTSASKTDYEQIKEYFRGRGEFELRWRVPSANPKVKDRVNSVNAMLRNVAGERRTLIHPRCKELITDLYEVAWKKGGQFDLEKDADRRRTHASDALGYLVWGDYRLGRFERQPRA